MNHIGMKELSDKLTPLTTPRSKVTVGLSVMNDPSMTGTNAAVPQKAEIVTASIAWLKLCESTATRQAKVSDASSQLHNTKRTEMRTAQLSYHLTHFAQLTSSSYNSCKMMCQKELKANSTTTVSYRRNKIISSVLRRQECRARYSCSEQGRICPARMRLLHKSAANEMESKQRQTTTCWSTEPAPSGCIYCQLWTPERMSPGQTCCKVYFRSHVTLTEQFRIPLWPHIVTFDGSPPNRLADWQSKP